MVPMHKAQQQLPKLCRSGRAYLITNRDRPAAVLLAIDDYEALMETMEVLSNAKAMRALRSARAGKLKYRRLNLADENFGL
jgi:prevent-host-death family protein